MPHRIKYEVGTLAVDGWAVTFGTAMRGLDGASARPGPSLLYQSPYRCIMVHCSAVLVCP